MQLNRTTTHAVRLLVACAKAEAEIVKVAEIAEGLGLSQQNAFKIVHLLSRAGFLSAVRGRNGGVGLARPAEDIRIGEVVLAMEFARFDQDSGNSQGVPLVGEAFQAFIDVLNQNSVADVAKTVEAVPARKRAAKAQKTAVRRSEARARPVAKRSPAARLT